MSLIDIQRVHFPLVHACQQHKCHIVRDQLHAQLPVETLILSLISKQTQTKTEHRFLLLFVLPFKIPSLFSFSHFLSGHRSGEIRVHSWYHGEEEEHFSECSVSMGEEAVDESQDLSWSLTCAVWFGGFEVLGQESQPFFHCLWSRSFSWDHRSHIQAHNPKDMLWYIYIYLSFYKILGFSL